MHTKIRPYALAMLVSTTAWTSANAVSISLTPTSVAATVGSSVLFDLKMDFSDDPTLGGGIDFFYNTNLLEFKSFVRSTTLGDDPGLRREPDVRQGIGLNDLGFANFNGIAGPALVGQLTFKALAAGHAAIALDANGGGPPDNLGPFLSATPPSDPNAPPPIQNVTFTGAAIDISPSAVPLPGALPLMLSLGAGLAGFVRRRSTTV